MPTPNFRKVIIEDNTTQVSIYAGAVKIQSKFDRYKRIHLRIVEKPASAGPGVLFVFKKLTIQVQAQTFENIIEEPAVKSWFLTSCKQLLDNTFASEN